jgi:hypothetical protein
MDGWMGMVGEIGGLCGHGKAIGLEANDVELRVEMKGELYWR